MENITYFIGAGASYYSCPIWKEQGIKMIELAKKYLVPEKCNFEKRPSLNSEKEEILWDIGYFGLKAEKYGTLDTYARKLFLNQSHLELSRLKSSVSIFFTLWHLTDDFTFKSRKVGEEYFNFEEIDRRYISLLAAITETKNNKDVTIKDNIRFVTWNYDLQLEFAFKAFNHDVLSLEYISQNLKVRCKIGDNDSLQICHLNGYHGFYYTDQKEYDFLTVSKSKDIDEILDSIGYVSTSERRKQLQISNHINYAWESNPLAEKTRTEANRIFSETDILVIIGYSFPNFNKGIDKMFFDKLKGRRTKIYYQDPNASEIFINQLVDSNETEVICDRVKKDNFYLPYEF
jgi:hypothetical protein